MLGRVLALLCDTLNPERIVIGSIFVRCEELLRPAMQAVLEQEALPQAVRDVQIVPAQTGETQGDLASIMTALYAQNVDLMAEMVEQDEKVLSHYERLFERYPAL